MPTVAPNHQDYRKAAGDEPLPGYRLIEPLGKGGFGEVWKCEAPGGLLKAAKFVFDDREGNSTTGDESLRQEFDAFQRIKLIRHPFLLMLERVELVRRELIMIMELADQNLLDVFNAYRAQRYPGIPREELLAYLSEAAEALDVIATKHGLQHLDIKPANLFAVSGHCKVGDFGLVNGLQAAANPGQARGLTPKYTPPEVLNGRVEAVSDQYSLALVYQELLTGTFPYPARSAQQMMLQHATAEPKLAGLPPCDQHAIARALAKNPAHRFPSCVALIEVLMDPMGTQASPDTWRDHAGSSLMMRRARMTQSSLDLSRTSGSQGRLPPPSTPAYNPPSAEVFAWPNAPAPAPPPASGFDTAPDYDPQTIHGGEGTPAPMYPHQRSGMMRQSAMMRQSGMMRIPEPPPNASGFDAAADSIPPGKVPALTVQQRSGSTVRPPDWEAELVTLSSVNLAAPAGYSPPSPPVPGGVFLDRILPVVPVAAFTGLYSNDRYLPQAIELAEAVVRAAVPGGGRPPGPGELTRTPEGGWACRFPAKALGGMAHLKLEAFCQQWQMESDLTDPQRPTLRRLQPQGFFGKLSGKQAGVEVIVHLPPPERSVGEVTIEARLFGTPDAAFTRSAQTAMPQMVDEMRTTFQNVLERRTAVRVPVDFLMELYPLANTGQVLPAIPARCRDVSAGGVCFATRVPIHTSYVYVAFVGVGAAAGFAILTRVLRVTLQGEEQVIGGRYKMEV